MRYVQLQSRGRYQDRPTVLAPVAISNTAADSEAVGKTALRCLPSAGLAQPVAPKEGRNSPRLQAAAWATDVPVFL